MVSIMVCKIFEHYTAAVSSFPSNWMKYAEIELDACYHNQILIH